MRMSDWISDVCSSDLVNPRLSAPEVEYQLTDADVMAVVVSEEHAELLDRVALPPGVEVIRTGAAYDDLLLDADPGSPSPGVDLDASTVAETGRAAGRERVGQ